MNTEIYKDSRVKTNNNYYLTSRNNSVEEIYNSSGTKTKNYNYTAYGMMGASVEGYTYTGEQQEKNGLIYLRARYYKPEYGQFISKDTYKGTTTNILSQNQYTYVENNPVKYVDSSGNVVAVAKASAPELLKDSELSSHLVKRETSLLEDIIQTTKNALQMAKGIGSAIVDKAKALGTSIVKGIFTIGLFKHNMSEVCDEPVIIDMKMNAAKEAGKKLDQFKESFEFLYNITFGPDSEEYRQAVYDAVQNYLANTPEDQIYYDVGYKIGEISFDVVLTKLVADAISGKGVFSKNKNLGKVPSANLDAKLLKELIASGAKYNLDDIIFITKNAEGKLMWLEKGNALSGLSHIVIKHADEFAGKGITNIAEFLKEVLKTAPINTGANSIGPFAEYLINGQKYRVVYGTNGYLVSFYPFSP